METLSRLRNSTVKCLSFSSYSSEELKSISVAKIITPLSFNSLGHPLHGGLYDPALGPVEFGGECSTCKMKQLHCPGHFGHIELPLPVLNPLFHNAVKNVLKISCHNCSKILLPPSVKSLLFCQLKLSERGYYHQALELENIFSNDIKPWGKTVKDEEAAGLLTSINMEQHVEEILSTSTEPDQAVKGDGEFRNLFIKQSIGYMYSGKRCPFCNENWNCFKFISNRILRISRISEKKSNLRKSNIHSGLTYVTPVEVMEYLKKIWLNDEKFMSTIIPILKHSTDVHPVNILFLTNIIVTPSTVRPPIFIDDIISEHPQNTIYKAILSDCLVLKSIIVLMNNESTEDSLLKDRLDVVKRIRGNDMNEKLQYSWHELQTNVNTLLDIDMKKGHNQQNVAGLKQTIEKKEGILRMNMMGKRVNFAARTVITPDPNLNVDEIGIPEIIAKSLTYPVPVNAWNVIELRKLVMNGPDIHPGANFIEDENNRIFKISGKDPISREAFAKRLLTPGEKSGAKIVHRHLMNGDIVLANRQPTLHRPSIMAHKARVLKGEKVFRLHYGNCKAYNADFDGDEMNVHFPQNEVARSEAYNLVNVFNHYLVPKDGTPLCGLIQDHVIAGVKLTVRGKMFTKFEYEQLVWSALYNKPGNIKTMKPCIIKPIQLWSGKQVISTVIKNIIPPGKSHLNLSTTAKISHKSWIPRHPKSVKKRLNNEKIMSEEEVIIRQGELLSGVLDKMHIGASSYGLVHCMQELYGGEVSGALLSAFSKLFTAYHMSEGFTLGVEDIVVLKHNDKKRSKIIEKVRNIGDEIVKKVIKIPANSSVREELAIKHKADPSFRDILDHQYKTDLDTFTNEINNACISNGLLKPFPDNNLQLMVQSGSKGSSVNAMQISCLLGQIELEGKRPPLMITGKSLPCFGSYDSSPSAGGFIDGRFETGISPYELFYHSQAGREGLIDTAVKTSRSGYLQRCLIKHLEGVNVQYDMTVRDSDGSVIQFLYGEDGLDVTKSSFLNKSQLPFLADNYSAIHDEKITNFFKEHSNSKAIRSHKKKVKKWNESTQHLKYSQNSAFLKFCNEKSGKVPTPNKIDPTTGRTYSSGNLCKLWNKLSCEEKLLYKDKRLKTPNTVVSEFKSDQSFGSITEKLELIMDNYMKTYTGTVTKKEVETLVSEKVLLSLCQPGESVGLLAAQSIGEPSTQMTLNTFHFAGRGEMNVTLGIPRLREILMVASKNIKTPSMVIPFTGIPSQDDANVIRKKFTQVTLADVLQNISVEEKLVIKPEKLILITILMNFLPCEAYKENTFIKPKQIIQYVKKVFTKNLVQFLNKQKKSIKEMLSSEGETAARIKLCKYDEEEDEEDNTSKQKFNTNSSAPAENRESSDDEPEIDDDDATTARKRARHVDQEYSDIEDDVETKEEVALEEADEEMEVDVDQEEKENVKSQIEVNEGRKSDVTTKIPTTKRNDSFLDFKYDTEKQMWCEIRIPLTTSKRSTNLALKLKEFCKKSIVYKIPGIKRAIVQAEKGDAPSTLRTDGINMAEIFNYNMIDQEIKLDLKRLYTNDIHAMAETYGIEAARTVIVKEVQNVFKVYGITVDPRHLNLVADYMSFSGVYRPMSRKGLEGGASPLQQMSFESSLGFLKNAALTVKKEELSGPSSLLVIGAPVKSGTGSFSLHQKINF